MSDMAQAQPIRADTLLIVAGFFGYAAAIRAALEARGRTVAWFEDRPATDTVSKAALRVAPSLMRAKSDAYFAALAERLRGSLVRDVLVIKGEALSLDATKRLRKALPAATFTLYFWDSYRNMGAESFEKVALFDRSFTFDPIDADADQRLRYRPLFYLDAYAQLPRKGQDIDLLFVGTAHADRYAVTERIARQLPKGARFRRVMYMPSRGLFEIRRALDLRMLGARASDFIFRPLSSADVLALVARSRAVVDIERSIQAGFTMRTIEALGAGRKLVTTNPHVARADFYTPDTINVIDRHRPHVDLSFLCGPYRPPPAHILQRYSLTGWLDEILPSTRSPQVEPLALKKHPDAVHERVW